MISIMINTTANKNQKPSNYLRAHCMCAQEIICSSYCLFFVLTCIPKLKRPPYFDKVLNGNHLIKLESRFLCPEWLEYVWMESTVCG